MAFTNTEQQLSQITDEGLFEKLAMAVLRDAERNYRAMVHTGVNADGKTIKSPVDGILYLTNTDPPRLVVVHHTTTAPGDLRKKWLHDPASVKPRRQSRPTAPAGDLLKAVSVIVESRREMASLQATLVLTTNQEPDPDLVRDVTAAALKAGISVDIWHRSRLAHFLDTTAKGQWLRRQYLGIDAEILSRELLLELSKASVASYAPRDKPEAWVDRELDGVLATAAHRMATFLVAPSGLGKSVAGYRWLTGHIERGGAGLVLPHDTIASALTISGAIGSALRQLCPRLGNDAGTEALALASTDQPLYLIVEDINLSGQSALLAERIEGWARIEAKNSANLKRDYRLVCPLWPSVLASMREDTRRAVSALAVFGSSLTPVEGRRAVQRRATLSARSVSDMAADAVSAALGHDPLLIALHDPSRAAAPSEVIGVFVEEVVGQVSVARLDYTAPDYRASLRAFAGAALHHRMLNPIWRDVRCWPGLDAEDLVRLSHLLHDGNLLHLSGRPMQQRVDFRHDRVRDWLLADAAGGLAEAGILHDEILGEPYFAEIIGGVLALGQVVRGFVSRVRAENPLALFHGLRLLTDSSSVLYKQVVTAIDEWLSLPSTHERSNRQLRLEALAVLAETEGPDVIRLVSLFKEQDWAGFQARFRNGDLSGGINLCATIEPGTGAEWRDILIEHAKHKFGRNLALEINELLRQENLGAQTRVGALRLAGHLADPILGDAIANCWALDTERERHLSDYLWACAECFETNAERYLQPVCDAWAALPSSEEDDNLSLSRKSLAADHVRWAFRKWVPTKAIPYFVIRAQSEALRWPITHMLSEIDDPVAVDFVVREMAEMECRAEGRGSTSTFAEIILPREWRSRQEEYGVGMSEASRRPLQMLWTNPGTDKYLRRAAFWLWAATHMPGDLAILRNPALPADLADSILRERLLRSDHDAAPALLRKLKELGSKTRWWLLARHVWTDELLDVLDGELGLRAKPITPECCSGNDTDYVTSDLIMRLLPEVGEALLIKHWEKLQYIENFVHAALFLATPKLQDLAGKTIALCPDPKKLLAHVGQHFGLKIRGHPGVTREAQIKALAPHLSYLAHHEVRDLWEICNSYGWFTLRRSLLDPHLRARGGILYEDEAPTFADLDDMVATSRITWIGHWLEGYSKIGATSAMIIARIHDWFTQRRTLEALILVANVHINIGRRCDLAILDMTLNSPEPFADAVRVNTAFAVKRRSLH